MPSIKRVHVLHSEKKNKKLSSLICSTGTRSTDGDHLLNFASSLGIILIDEFKKSNGKNLRAMCNAGFDQKEPQNSSKDPVTIIYLLHFHFLSLVFGRVIQ